MKERRGNHIPSGYMIKIFESVNDLAEVKNAWTVMNRHPNADIDFYITICTQRKARLRPHVLVLYADHKPQAMMIGRLESSRMDLKIGYIPVISPTIRLLTIVHGGLLGDFSPAVSEIFVKELLNSLRNREFDSVLFGGIPIDSAIYPMIRTIPNLFCRDNIPSEGIHWKAALTPTLDEFLKKISRKHRYWVRRMANLLEKDFPGKVRIESFTDQSTVDQLCTDVESIACQTYHRGLGVGFIDNPENRARLTLSAEKKWLRAYILYVGDKPCSFWIATHYGNTVHLNFTGYDSKYEKYEPGTVLFIKMVEDFCKEGIREMDYGSGDAKYKSRFGDSNWKEASIYIFSPSLKGIWINFVRTSSSAFNKVTKQFLEKTSLLDSMKKSWRKRVAAGDENKEN